MRARRLAAAIALVTAVFALASDAVVGHMSSGMALVRANYQKAPPSEAHAGAWSQAWRLAERYPDDLGYPWIDTTTGELVVRATTDSGDAVAQGWIRSGAVPMRVDRAIRSLAQLERIKDEAIGPGVADLPDGDAIYMSAPDFDHNRVVLTVDRLSPSLLRALAGRYGTQAIAIHLDRRRPTWTY